MRGRAQIGLAVVLLAALACRSPETPKKSDPGETPGLVTVPTNPGAPLGPPVTVVVGQPGGAIASADGKLAVTIPADTVASPTEFRVTPVANTARGAVGGSAFRLRPEGSVFARPVTLTFKGPEAYPAGSGISAVGVEYQDVRGYWHRVEPVARDATANTLTVTTDHFSDWALVWQNGTAALEGPMLLAQGVGIPFTASGRSTLFLVEDDTSMSTYVLTGTLTIPAQIPFGASTCTPDQVTKTLNPTVAELLKTTPPVFRFGLSTTWTLTCTNPTGGVSTHVVSTQFDTMRIKLLRCAGWYGPGQVTTPEIIQGSYTSDCGIEGTVTGTWDLKKCIPDQPCDAGVCRDGRTVCTNGIASCEDRGPATDGTLCGADNLVCSQAQCVDLLDPLIGIHIAPTSGLLTTEAGGTATYSIVLGVRPTIEVVVGLSTSSGEGAVDPQTVTFTPLDWDIPQNITVTGLDDFIQDGNQPYVVANAPAVSIDPRYTGLDPEDVSVTNLDDDVAGIKVTAAEGLSTSEPAGVATFTVELTSQPLADVSLALSSSDTTEGVVSPLSLSFSAANWNVPQTVTVTGRDDAVVDGAQTYAIQTAPAVSTDVLYNAFDAADVTLSNADNDAAGITVQPTGGLQTTEAGASATFTVALRSEPIADVVIPVSSLDPTEGSVSPTSLTFTALDWNVPQEVTVTGENDAVADGTVLYDIVTEPAASADVLYVGMDAADVSVSNVDDDFVGVTVNAAPDLTVTEAGSTATFTVALTSEPTADVSIGIDSSDTTETTAAPATLVFAAGTWDVPQTVTITGVNDFGVDGPQGSTIRTAPATSADLAYQGLDASDVSVTTTDDDVAGIAVAPTSGLGTTEAGGTATFTIVLGSQPTADVTIALSSSDTTEATVSPASVTFTSANWNIAQTVTVTGANDAVVDGAQAYTILTAPAVSADTNYNGSNAADVTGSTADDDTVGIAVTPTVGLTTTEAGGTATFTIALGSEPTADVTIPLSSSNSAEGTVSPASVVFTVADWDVPQTVTARGVDDDFSDGEQPWQVITGAASSGDANYANVNAADVSVTNQDDDAASIEVFGVSAATMSEVGGSIFFDVVLASRPAPGTDVTFTIVSEDTTESTVSPATLTFNSSTWNISQRVTVSAADDALVDGDVLHTIRTNAATSADPAYQGLDPADVQVTTLDNDAAGVTVSPTSGLVTTEGGTTATFTIVLGAQPSGDVTIPLSSSGTDEGTVSPASVTFTNANWNVAQTVTVTGVNDDLVDGAQAFTIVTGAATSTDAAFSGFDAADVAVSNSDNDAAGVNVSPTSGLVTTEGGTTATFTIVLGAQPSGDVTIPLSSSAADEGTVSPASVVFTSANWNVAQTVTVTGVNDDLVDGAQAYTIQTGPATSADAAFNGFDAADVSVSNSDNDAAGVNVSPTSGLVTTEGGTTATFTIVLGAQPSGDVTISLSSSATDEGTVSPASVTFTNVNWNVAQTVTVTGVNDDLVDGAQAYTIVTGAATSTDAAFNGLNADDVAVSNSDNDSAGVNVSPTSGLVTTEGGTTATFTVVLGAQPSGDVTIALSSSDTTEGTVAPATVTFTNANWSAPQTVTVTGQNDDLVDGSVAYTIITGAAASSDAAFNGLVVADVSVSNTDNDAAGVNVAPVTGLTTTEAGGTATFTIVLGAQPTDTVTIPLSSNDTGEGTVSPTSVTFTTANWNVAQTVTVTGVNDDLVDGAQGYTIVTGLATSTDAAFSGFNAADVSVTNSDNDTAGITVSPTSGLTTTEAGGTATFTIVLGAQPTDTVTIPLSSNDTGEGTVSPTSVTFTTANWNVAQTVTVTGVNDDLVDGPVAYTIITAAAVSTDAAFSGFNPADVSVSNTDNDAVGITVAPTSGLATTEGGTTATFTIVLGAQPTADVTIALSSSDTTEGTVSPASVVFTNANWSAPQSVTVTGQNDDLVDGPVAYTIITAAAVSTDAAFSGFNPADVSVSNTDNDAVGITVAPTSGLTTSENGTTASFTIVLGAQPTADVTIALSSSDTTEGTVAPASVTFTNVNWSAPQTVTVTGQNDALVDGSVAYTIITAAAVSADAAFSGFDPADVSFSNTDNDAVGITVAPASGLTTSENGTTASFTIVLGAQPTADVTIALSSTDTTEGTVSPASVVFTNANWSAPQTVTVTGQNDALVDGSVVYTIITAAAVSTDAAFNGFDASDVSVTNTDNDAAGITVTPTAGLITTEGGTTATFTIVLGAQPTADVTIPLSSNDTTEGTVSPASVVFTNANWNQPQTVTVTGVDDVAVDGAQGYSIVTAPATGDAAFANFNAADVSVTNTDDDAAGVTVTPTAGLVTSEAGGTDEFTVVLTAQPAADVTVQLASSATAEGTVSPPSLTFTAANWNAPQTVTVTGEDDGVDDGDVGYTIVTTIVTTAPGFTAIDPADVSVTNTDDDAGGILVTPISGLVTTEVGGADGFTIALASQPEANVTISLSSTNTAEGTVSPPSVTFTPSDWSTPKAVTVTGVNDAADDGDIGYTIQTTTVTSDPVYVLLDGADVAVTNTDDDAADIVVTAAPSLQTTEGGGQATFTIVLSTQPSSDVSIALSSSNTGEGTVLPATVTFTSSDWSTPKTVTVTGVNDPVDDGNQTYSIATAAATSSDAAYSGRNAADITVTNVDDDTAGIDVVAAAGLTASELGGVATFDVSLATRPTDVVTITVASSNPADVTASPTTLTFDDTNWDLPQTVTVAAVNDFVDDDDQQQTITTSAASSGDLTYDGLSGIDVEVTTLDDDTAAIVVTPAAVPLVTSEDPVDVENATFTIVLTSEPTADVTITFAGDATEGAISPPSVTFTASNWSTVQTVTVTGVSDGLADGDQDYTIVTTVLPGDPVYTALGAQDVDARNLDDGLVL